MIYDDALEILNKNFTNHSVEISKISEGLAILVATNIEDLETELADTMCELINTEHIVESEEEE